MSYVPVTVPSSSVASNLSGFPVYVDLSTLPQCFWDGVYHDDGRDIRARTTAGAELPFDLVSFDRTSQSGALFVRVDLSASVALTFHVDFGDGSRTEVIASASNGRNAVWADYHRVFLLGGVDGWIDRTGNGTRPNPDVNVSSFLQTAVSGDVQSHQGVEWDGAHFYVFDTNEIRKYDSGWNLVATNSDPCGDVGGSVDHVGDGVVVGGVIYLPVQQYTYPATFSNGSIARFNASDLTFIDATDITAQSFEASGICYDERADVLYVTSFVDGTTLRKYHRSSLSFLGTLALSSTVPNAQGATIWRNRFWITSDGPTPGGAGIENALYSVKMDGAVLGRVMVYDAGALDALEGITHDDDSLYILDSPEPGTSGTVYRLDPVEIEAGAGARFSTNGLNTDDGHNVATGLTRFTTWTLGVSAVIRAKGAASQNFINYTISGGTPNGSERAAVAWRQSSDRLGIWNQADGWLEGSAAPSVGVTYRLHDVHEGTTQRKYYEQGVLKGTDTGITAMPVSGASALYFGTTDAGLIQPLDGSLGFVYLRDEALSADWIAAEVANMHAPNTFYSVGSCSLSSGYVVEVDAIDRNPLLATFNIQAPINGIVTMRADFESEAAPIFMPNLDDEIIMTDQGTVIFGGYITAIKLRGFGGPNGDAVVVETTSADYKIATTRRVVNEAILGSGSPALTLKDILLVLEPYLTPYGITLDPAQVDGPSVDPVFYEDRILKDVLDELSVLTGYVWDIDASKVFRMYEIGTISAPFNIDESDDPALYFDDITVEPTREQYANRIMFRYGPKGDSTTTDTFFGDGVTDSFALSAPLTNYAAGVYVALGYVTAQATASPQVNETLSMTGEGGDWEFDPVANTITRTLGAPANGDVIQITYIGRFPVTLTVEDAGEIASHGLFELVVNAPETKSVTLATAQANAELQKHLTVLKRVTYFTRELGIFPGMTQSIVIPKRDDLNITAVITEVVHESEPGGDLLVRRVTALEGNKVQGDWREVYRQWLA